MPSPSQYNIQTANWLDKTSPTGITQPTLTPLADTCDLDHRHVAFVQMCDRDPVTQLCKMDGAGNAQTWGTCPTQPQFRFVDNSTGILNPYLELVTQYGWANYFFQTNQGPSLPAHQFLFGGTSAPTPADDGVGVFVESNQSKAGPMEGCIAPAGATVTLISPAGDGQKIYPCFEHETLADVLPPLVTWRYYAPSADGIWTAPMTIQHICQSTGPGGICTGTDWNDHVDLNPADVLTDIAACNLRSVSWVTPSGLNSDHSNLNDGGGPSWVASIVNAIGSSTACDNNTGYWRNTAIIILWDDWGGWYDHEAPTILALPQGDFQYGFRVPLLFVSAYTRPRFINNVRHDFGTILRFIEHNFGVREGQLKFADARAQSDFGAFYNFTLPPRKYMTISAPLDATFFLEDKRKQTDPDDQ